MESVGGGKSLPVEKGGSVMAWAIQVEGLPIPLQFSFIAEGVRLAVARFARLGRVGQEDKEAISKGSALLNKAFEAGSLIEKRSMAGFSAEAVQARIFAVEAAQQVPEAPDTTKACLEIVNRVQQVGTRLSEDRPVGSVEVRLAEAFWRLLGDVSLATLATPIERVTRQPGV
jgi:hypothetical protein